MGIQQLWNEYELYFYYEFVNDSNFLQLKKDKLEKDMGYFYIAKDFTIYQEKANPINEINETDFHRNFGTFICILYNLPINKVRDFIQFHYDKYIGNKINFLEFVYHELNGSKSSQGAKELPPPQQKIITMTWCQEKINELQEPKKHIITNQKLKMNSKHISRSKLIALKERVISIQKIHSSVPVEIFDSMKNQFLKDVEKLKLEFADLADFVPSNYNEFKTPHDSYFRWASEALISDIKYFIDFLENIEVGDLDLKISNEGIYFSGQHFDALLKFNEIISTATTEIILIDNYLNEKILEVLGSKNTSVKCKVLTFPKSLSSTLTTFIEAFNKQYQNLEVKTTTAFHDRFVILDKKDFYHFGASLKDVGNKGFMFSKIEEDFIKKSLLQQVEIEWQK